MSEEGAEVTRRIRRRRGTSPAAPESLPFNDDMLREVLVRLSPQPSSLPRASAVCKRWLGLVTDPRFLPRFRANHRKPPLLGVFRTLFKHLQTEITFRPILDPPDRIPPQRLDLRCDGAQTIQLLGCRHGRVLLVDHVWNEVIVCDPITGDGHDVKVPPEIYSGYGAVVCAAADQDHVHGSCHSNPFKVVLMSLWGDEDEDEEGRRPIACVYSSETGIWGNVISSTTRCQHDHCNPGILIGNAIYWSSKSENELSYYVDWRDYSDDIIEFDMDRQSLAVIKGPPDLLSCLTHQIIQAEEGVVGLAILSHGRLKMWQRKINGHGGATWLLQKTVEMHTVLGIPPLIERSMKLMQILGYDEDNGAIFVYVDTNVYMIQLLSMQFKKLYESDRADYCHPFTSFYAPGIAIRGGDEAEMLHDT